MENTNAVVPQGFYMDDDEKFVADLTTRKTSYCSLVATTDEEKAILFNIMNNPENRLADCINMTVDVKDIFVEVVQCTNQTTGEQTPCPRIVLIDKDGVGYQAVSLGVYGALKKVMDVFGEPKTWTKPLPLKVKQITKGEKKLLTFEIDAIKGTVKAK